MAIEEGATGEFGMVEMDSDLAFVGGELDEVFFVCNVG